MYCQKCGVPIADANQFCGKCGHGINTPIVESKLPATTLKRLANYLIDNFARKLLAAILIFIAVAGQSKGLYVLAFVVFFGYYIFCESIWQQTLGKLITGTKVVGLDGQKPRFWRIVGRSLARLIPFEILSFLFGGFPVGWHDRFSKTLVVPKSLTPEDVQQMNFEEIKKKKSNNTAVIIIIVSVGILTVIAIIGILASVVLASVNAARAKGQDAATKAILSEVKVEAAVYENAKNNYSGFCSDSNTISLLSAIPAVKDTDPVCNDAPKGYAVSTLLHTDKYFCIDATGLTTEITTQLSPEVTNCPTD